LARLHSSRCCSPPHPILLFFVSLFAPCPIHFFHSFPTRRSSDLILAVASQSLPPNRHLCGAVRRQGMCCLPPPAHRSREGILPRSEEHTSELQSHLNLVCRLLVEKKQCKEFRVPRPCSVKLWLPL